MSSPALSSSRIVAASPVYYGWVVLAAATLTLALSLPGQTAGVALFIDSFIADAGVSRGAVAGLYTLATVLAALTLPLTGRALDRWGPRLGAVTIAAGFAATLAGMAFVSGPLTLFLGFVGLRALGQGGLSLVSVHAVNLWFVRRRGRAVGLMGVGIALTTAFGPPLLEAGIAGLGWRTTYLVLGAGLGAVLLPIGYGLFRERPEAYGLLPDGPGGGGAAPLPPERALDLHAARRTPIFWLLAGSVATTAGIGTGLLFHHVAVMAAGGVDRAAAALLFVPFGLVTVGANFGAGALIDRIGPRRVLVAQLLGFAAMVAAVPEVRTAGGVLAYGVVFGLVQGLQNNLAGSAFAYYFGRRHIGAIKGFVTSIVVAGTATGPLLLAAGEGIPGGYATALRVLALVPVGLAALALRPRFDRPPA
jgi:MFS family permease